MKNKIIPILWILPGLLYLYHGLNGYWNYSREGVLFLITLPETLLTHHIILGLLSLIIGIKLFQNNNKIYMFVFSYGGWILLLTLMHFIYEIIKHNDYRGWGDCILDYLMFIPIFITIGGLKKENVIQGYGQLKDYYKRHYLMIIIQSVFIFFMTIWLADYFPYSTFYFLHE
jgi:hypothetical protein